MARVFAHAAGHPRSGVVDPSLGLATARHMKEFRKLVRSGQHLVVFEIAARHCSFAGAARELGVTQPAVSRYIRELETALGVGLFARHPKSVELTDAGEMLFAGVSAGLAQVLRVARRLPRPSPGHVVLLVPPAFAQYWIVPRLSQLQAKNSVDLRIQICDRHVAVPDDGSTLAVRLGDGTWDGYECVMLLREELFPVASPDYAGGLADSRDVASLAGETLIHEEMAYLPTTTWEQFFEAMGVDYTDDGTGLRLTSNELVLQAAIAGQGVALGSSGFVDSMLERGLLVMVSPRRLSTDQGFYLLWPVGSRLSPNTNLVREWMVEAAAAAQLVGTPQANGTEG